MKRIVRLTESDLTRIVRRVIKEQNEKKTPNLQVRALKVKNPQSSNYSDNYVEVTTDTNSVIFNKCTTNTDVSKRDSCFSLNTATMENGTYPPLSFSGDIFVYYKGFEYRCKLNKPCSSKSLKPSF